VGEPYNFGFAYLLQPALQALGQSNVMEAGNGDRK
jgi:hypothetical protein